MLPIATQQPNVTWREWIDLEHDVIYTPYIHWNALTVRFFAFFLLSDSIIKGWRVEVRVYGHEWHRAALPSHF